MNNDETYNQDHINLSVGCYGKCGGFRVEEGKFICDCGKDFTDQAKNIFQALKQSLRK
jgi:hypothetical protein